jgi:hypothetical protein
MVWTLYSLRTSLSSPQPRYFRQSCLIWLIWLPSGSGTWIHGVGDIESWGKVLNVRCLKYGRLRSDNNQEYNQMKEFAE